VQPVEIPYSGLHQQVRLLVVFHAPTADLGLIHSHMNAYTNPNYTVWADAGYTFPKNSLWDGC
jgi:hypothetical protein